MYLNKLMHIDLFILWIDPPYHAKLFIDNFTLSLQQFYQIAKPLCKKMNKVCKKRIKECIIFTVLQICIT